MIYIVEDDASIRELEQYALQTNGYEAAGCEDGASFWAALRDSAPDLVILDVMLPDEDGYQILNKLRADPATRTIPVIMVTAKTSEIDVVKGLDHGADDYLCKPFGIMEFISRVKAVLRRAQAAAPAPAPKTLALRAHRHGRRGPHRPGGRRPGGAHLQGIRPAPSVSGTPRAGAGPGSHHEGGVGHRRPFGIPHHRHACAYPAPETGRRGESIRTVRKVGYKLSTEGADE